jgi:ribosome biogenesis protein NSA2
MYNKKRHSEKIQMKRTLKMHEERKTKQKSDDNVPEGAVPAYLLDRETQNRAKILSNMIKQKRKEKAGKWEVPLPKVKGVSEAEVFKVVKTGKTRSKYHSFAKDVICNNSFPWRVFTQSSAPPILQMI